MAFLIGIIEDILIIKLLTKEPITLRMIGLIVLIAIPFAFLGEILVDQVDFIDLFRKIFKESKK